MSRLVDAVLPARMGTSFRWLVGSSWTSNLGDGIGFAAGPLQGRVGSLYSIGVFGGLVIGQGLGGVIARLWGITAPFWFAFGGSALILVAIWRQLALIAHADEPRLDPAV